MSYAVDLSTYGRELKSAYDNVISSDPNTRWAIFNYDASSNAVKPAEHGGTGLEDFVESFDDNKVQYGIAQVESSNVNKIVLVGWVGEGVPDRTKGYFNAHFATVAKYFGGYHVQITARSSEDITPAIILKKVDAAAGSKYSGGGRPPPSTKPRYKAAAEGADEDDWGDAKSVEVRDTPALNKASSAYKPTRVDISEIRQAAKKSQDAGTQSKLEGLNSSTSYKPVGKVDIAALREAGKNSKFADTRIEKIENSYKPVGKVDIKAIREQAKKQEELATSTSVFGKFEKTPSKDDHFPPPKAKASPIKPDPDTSDEPQFKSLSERMKAFNSDAQAAKPNFSSAKGTSAPKRTASQAPSSGGTTPWGNCTDATKTTHTSQATPGFKDFGSSGGKTPAQLWAEKQGKRAPTQKETVSGDQDDERKTLESEPSYPVSDVKGKFENIEIDEKGGASHVSDLKGRFEGTGLDKKDDEPQKVAPKLTDDTPPPPPSRAVPPSLPARDESPELPSRSTGSGERSATPSAALTQPSPPPPPQSVRETPAEEDADDDEGITALVENAYEQDPSADDEISLVVGERIKNIDKIDENWWFGTKQDGSMGLFPAEYVRVDDEASASAEPTPTGQANSEEPAGATAVATFDYDAGDDDELSFKEGDVIVNVEFPSEDWWSGELNGKQGLFPATYVLQQ